MCGNPCAVIGQTAWIIRLQSSDHGSSDIASLLEELAVNGQQGIIVLGPENIEFCNDKARELNDVPKSVLMAGKPWIHFFEYQYQRGDFGEGASGQDFFNQLLENFKKRKPETVVRKAGNGRILRADRSPNSIGGMTLTLTDITDLKIKEHELKVALKQAEAAKDAKSRFLVKVSHELRTPLNAILNMAELLGGSQLNPEQCEMSNAIHSSGSILLEIVNDVLEFTAIEAGELTLTQKNFDIQNCVDLVMKKHRSSAKKKGLGFSVHRSPDFPTVFFGDQARLYECLENLVGNAIKFTNIGDVSIVLRRRGEDAIRIEINDTGIGIPSDKLELIFADFQQVESSYSRSADGSGLGLSITKQLIELMEGEISVQSEIGFGTSIYVDLPILSLASERPHEAPIVRGIKNRNSDQEFDQTVPPRNLCVAIAEDNATNRLVIKKLLSASVKQLVFWENGQIALDEFEAVNADLIFMDISMPIMDGIEATKSIRKAEQDAKRPQTPIIALTANTLAQDKARCEAAGMNGFLTKPVRKAELISAIDEATALAKQSAC